MGAVMSISVWFSLTEHAGPCSWRENLLLKGGKDGDWGHERQLPFGGSRVRNSRQLQVKQPCLSTSSYNTVSTLTLWPDSLSLYTHYSLTWTDAHLHRQLITVLRGPVVESFDREFRILFAASLPVPNTSKAIRPPADMPHQRKEFSDLCHPKHLQTSTPPEASPPPPPLADSPLDWDALGVIQGGCYLPNGLVDQHEEIKVTERPLLNAMPLHKKIPSTVDELAQIRKKPLDDGRYRSEWTQP